MLVATKRINTHDYMIVVILSQNTIEIVKNQKVHQDADIFDDKDVFLFTFHNREFYVKRNTYGGLQYFNGSGLELQEAEAENIILEATIEKVKQIEKR